MASQADDRQAPAPSLKPPQEMSEAEKDRERAALELHVQGLTRIISNLTNPKIRAARNLLRVRLGGMSPDAFYRELGTMDLGGQEPRFFLMELKKDILNYQGKTGRRGLNYFFGPEYRGGGSYVEGTLLTWRKKIVMEGIRSVLSDFKGQNIIDGKSYSVYMAEIGSWTEAKFTTLTFAGDIDFSFVSGNLDLARRMKAAFDGWIKNRVGMTAEAFDGVCTAHGMATPEVYVGPHGRKFAEDAIRSGKDVHVIDLEQGKMEGRLPGKEALVTMYLEQKIQVTDDGLPKSNHPSEPGISLEMIRHFLHDIVHQNVYTDIDSFLKAAKYLDRSNVAIEKNFGGRPAANPDLVAFARKLVEMKKGLNDPKANVTVDDIVAEIKDHFKGDLPWKVDLGPSENGKSVVALEANQKLIKGFWDTCTKAMWANANQGFDATVRLMKNKIGRVRDIEQAKKVQGEIEALRNMMEVEWRVLKDPSIGVDVPDSIGRLMKKMRGNAKQFAKKWGLELADPKTQQTYKFVDENLKAGRKLNIQMAMAALVNAPERINAVLDMLDDTLLGDLRGERGGDWRQFLTESRELTWAKKTEKFLALDKLRRWTGLKLNIPRRVQAQLNRSEGIVRGIEDVVNTTIFDNCMARGIKKTNQVLAQSIQSSRLGRATMKGLVVFNLSQEIPAYVNLLSQGDWEALATEFFRRRVPGGTVVENLIMGRYMQAGWDSVVLLVPPLALFSTAESIGEGLAHRAWKYYWSKELDDFTDSLFKTAEFQLVAVEHYQGQIKLSQWKLVKASYQGRVFDNISEFVQRKQKQIGEMEAALRVKHSEREFPTEHTLDGITGWFKVNDMLRENIAANDAWLITFEAMRENPVAGPKLKDNYHDMWLTRWEKVKLGYVRHLIKLLEDRKAAEQAYLSDQLPKMWQELEKITKQLKIWDRVEAELNEKLGGKFIKFMLAVNEYLTGFKTTIPPTEPGVWDQWKENTRLVHAYLRAYKKVLEARTKAEGEYRMVAVDDHGVRLLTGPYFLDGTDQGAIEAADTWQGKRGELKAGLETTLTDIKAKYVDGGLDTAPDSFDQRILGEAADHDLWRDIWKYVHSEAQPANPGVLRSIYLDVSAYLWGSQDTGADEQELAKSRHRYHKQELDRLLALFEQHYFNQATKLLDELDGLAARAEALAHQAEADCGAAQETAEAVSRRLAAIEAELGAASGRLDGLAAQVEQLPGLVEQVGRHHGQVELEATALGQAAHNLESLSLSVCQTAQQIKSTTDEQRAAELLAKIQPAEGQAKQLLAEAKNRMGTARQQAGQARSRANQVAQAVAQVKNLGGLGALRQTIEDLNKRLDEVSQRIEAAKKQAPEIAKLKAEAQAKAEKYQRIVEPIKDLPAGKAGLERIEAALNRIDRAAERAQCSDQAQVKVDRAAVDLENLEGRLNPIAERRQQLLAQAEPHQTQAEEKAGLAEYVVTLAQDYLARAQRAAQDAMLCLVRARDIATSLAKVTVPSVVGMELAQAAGLLRSRGFVPEARTVGRVIDPAKAFKVKSQSPGGGSRAKKGSPVVLIHYGGLDKAAAVAALDCSRFPGSQARWDEKRQKAVCACKPGYVINKARNGCVDCVGLEKRFAQAINSGRVKSAIGYLRQGQVCPWAGRAQQAVNQACAKYEQAALRAAADGNIKAVQGIIRQANANGCRISQAGLNRINQLIAQHNRQRNQQQLQAFTNFMQQMIAMQQNRGNRTPPRTYRPPTTSRRPPTTSRSSRGTRRPQTATQPQNFKMSLRGVWKPSWASTAWSHISWSGGGGSLIAKVVKSQRGAGCWDKVGDVKIRARRIGANLYSGTIVTWGTYPGQKGEKKIQFRFIPPGTMVSAKGRNTIYRKEGVTGYSFNTKNLDKVQVSF